MSRFVRLMISDEEWNEVCNLANGTFHPLEGFMDSADYKNVVANMHLDNGQAWTIPITLSVPDEQVSAMVKSTKAVLVNSCDEPVAELDVEDVYTVAYERDIKKIFGTDDHNHPGVRKETQRPRYRVGGRVRLTCPEQRLFPEYSLIPQQTKKIFKERGWKTIVGFQTRNPIHRAHEYLQRVALETVDGLFIQPLVGWKKDDDFSPEAVVGAYEVMCAKFYPSQRAILGLLKTPMRYAGPREAVFHAIIRRNYGCTHFIVGRDHAGVGGYYGLYDAHRLCAQFDDLGIQILALCGPYYCKKCATIVTEKTCPHAEKYALSISGTQIRSMLKKGQRPPEEYMRKEIADVLIDLARKKKLFCGDMT